RDARVSDNSITGTRVLHMNERGNGVYIWNSPGAVVEGNRIRYGRDGLFLNTGRDYILRNNQMRDLRFAVHLMFAHNVTIEGNISLGNHLGFAVMNSDRAVVKDNLSLGDRD